MFWEFGFQRNTMLRRKNGSEGKKGKGFKQSTEEIPGVGGSDGG